MNAKGIKAIRWHKKCLIDAITAEDINISYIDETLESIINNLDTMRLEHSDISEAHDRGFTIGYEIGYNKGTADKTAEIGPDYTNRIDIRGISCGSASYYDGHVDDMYVGSSETIIGCVEVCKRTIATEKRIIDDANRND